MTGSATADLDHLSAWTHQRLGLGHRVADPLVALRAVVGVYSAHPSGPLALAARCAGLDAEGFRALEGRRAAVRVVGMRGSAFLVPVELADDIVSATRRRADLQPAVLRSRGLDAATFAALKPRILEAASQPVTPTQLAQALGAAKDDTRPYFAMRLLAREGAVVRVGTGRVRTDDLRWVATEAWLGHGLGEGDPDAALARLAERYLAAYGPARMVDFAWWAGVPRARAKRALESVETVDIGGGLLLPAELEAAWLETEPLDPEAIDVLPKWDSYTMAYAPDGRRRLVADEHLKFAYSTADTRIGATAGDGLPIILRGGRAVAAWSHRLSGSAMTVTVSPFDEVGGGTSPLAEAAEPEFESIGRLFEAKVDIQVAEG